jgi:hypothetical protein
MPRVALLSAASILNAAIVTFVYADEPTASNDAAYFVQHIQPMQHVAGKNVTRREIRH